MQRTTADTCELCLRLVTAIVEHVADAAAASSGEDRFEIEAQLLRQLMQDLPRQIKAAEEAARRTRLGLLSSFAWEKSVGRQPDAKSASAAAPCKIRPAQRQGR
jgi:hypothetical protein